MHISTPLGVGLGSAPCLLVYKGRVFRSRQRMPASSL